MAENWLRLKSALPDVWIAGFSVNEKAGAIRVSGARLVGAIPFGIARFAEDWGI